MKFPQFIHFVYRWNGLLLQRNKVVKAELKKSLRSIGSGQVMDAGCGEGMFILPYAQNYSNVRFTGIDNNQNNIDFCEKYKSQKNLSNASFLNQSLESDFFDQTFDLIYCIGTLQYLEDDVATLTRFHQHLKEKGTLIVYSPINGKTILDLYKHHIENKNNYEIQQNRKRIYLETELTKKLKTAGFDTVTKKYTYGYFGILGHEIYSVALIKIGSSEYFFWAYCILLIIFLPIILLLINVDYLLKKNNGNGLLLILKK